MTPAKTPTSAGQALDILRRYVGPGSRVAVSDGVGMPMGLLADLTVVAREVGRVSLVLGWCLELPAEFDPTAFADVRTFMAGYALRPFVKAGTVSYVPARLATMPALLESVWRPDVLLTSARPGRAALTFGTEVSWLPAAARAARHVVVEINEALPLATRHDELAGIDVIVGAVSRRAPLSVADPALNDAARQLGQHIGRWVPPGSAVQYGPGLVGAALLEQLTVPVRVDSGIITDAVLGLARRGNLIGAPRAGYLLGTGDLYGWANRRGILADVARLHDLKRLARERLVAVNTALYIDSTGQVAVEEADGQPIAGIGAHADYSLAASRAARGLSVLALPTTRGGHSTLVERLGVPTSTARSDVDIVVTERGSADLRGLSDRERTAAIAALWP